MKNNITQSLYQKGFSDSEVKLIRNRIYKGWDMERAINTPLNIKNRRSGYYFYNGMTIVEYLKHINSVLTPKTIYTR